MFGCCLFDVAILLMELARDIFTFLRLSARSKRFLCALLEKSGSALDLRVTFTPHFKEYKTFMFLRKIHGFRSNEKY